MSNLPRDLRRSASRPLWLALGVLCVALGIAGAVLPLLPTTPFLLAAAYAFARSSPRLHRWLTTHPRLGPPIEHWRAHGAIDRRAKILAVALMAAALALSIAMQVAWPIVLAQAAVLACVCLFILTRPDPPVGG